MKIKNFYSCGEAGEILCIHPITVWKMVQAGKLKALQYTEGGHLKIPREEIERLIGRVIVND